MILDLHLPVAKIGAVELLDSWGFTFLSSHLISTEPKALIPVVGEIDHSMGFQPHTHTTVGDPNDETKNTHTRNEKTHNHTTQVFTWFGQYAYVHGAAAVSLKGKRKNRSTK